MEAVSEWDRQECIALSHSLGISTRVRPAGRADIRALLSFLDYGFRHPWPPNRWQRLFNYPGVERAPNLGFVLESGHRLVGFLGAIYHERFIEGRVERFCNLTSWYVHPDFRSHSLALLTALLRQQNYTFVNFSPSDRVRAVMPVFGFLVLDTHKLLFTRPSDRKSIDNAILTPSSLASSLAAPLLTSLDETLISRVPESTCSGSSVRHHRNDAAFSYRPEDIRPLLSHIEQQLLDDHPHCDHFLLRANADYLYIITTTRQLILKSSRYQMPSVAAEVLYLSSTDTAQAHWPLLCDRILRYSGSNAIAIDGRWLAPTSGIGLRVPCYSYSRLRSGVTALSIDGLYSEITCLTLPIFA